jgi:hypothetical protein
LNIAQNKTVTAIFDRLIGGIDRVSQKFDAWTKNPEKLDKFFGTAGKNLDAWLKLIEAIGGFFGALIGASAGEGLKMVTGMTGAFNDLADKIRKNPKPIRDFFENVRNGLRELLPVLGKALIQLANAFTSKSFIDFTKFMIQTMVPGLILMIGVLGKLAGLLNTLFNLPVIGGAARFAAQILLGWFAATKLFPILKAMNPILKALFFSPLATIGKFVGGLIAAYEALKTFLFFARAEGVMATLAAYFPKLAAGIRLVGAALRFVFISNPWIAAIVIAIGLIYLLDRRFHFIRPTIEALGRVFNRVWEEIKGATRRFVNALVELFTHPIRFLKDHWKFLLINAVLAPFGLFPRLVFAAMSLFFPKFTNSVVDGFLAPFKWLAGWFGRIGSWFMQNLINPILRFFGIQSPSKRMFDIGMKVVNGFLNAIKSLPLAVLNIMKKLPGEILGLFTGFGKKLLSAIYDKLPGPLKKLIGGVVNEAGKVVGGIKKGVGGAAHEVTSGFGLLKAVGGDTANGPRGIGPSGTDTVPAWLTPGEWVLNKTQQQKLASRLGSSLDSVKKFLFGSKPENAPISNTKNPNEVGNGIQLIPHNDEYGQTLWWIQMRDGSWAQISKRAADRIIKSHGYDLPGYLRRNHGGVESTFGTPGHKALMWKGGEVLFNAGGSVSFSHSGSRNYSSGGVVSGPQTSSPSRGNNNIHQEFNVKTEGETDWHYVMRLGAQHAQGSF